MSFRSTVFVTVTCLFVKGVIASKNRLESNDEQYCVLRSRMISFS